MTGTVRAVLINDTRVDCHHGCTRVVAAIHRLCRDHGITVTATHPAHRDWRRDPHFAPHVDAADILIVNGEGSLHHSRPEAEPLLAAGGAARAAGKRSALINCSWQENDRRLSDALADFDIVAVRESVSLAAIVSARADCRLVPDLSICGPRFDSAQRSGIGFGDSVIPEISDELLHVQRRFGGAAMPIRFPGRGTARFAREFFSRQMLTDPRALMAAVRRLRWHRSSASDDEQYLRRLSHLELIVTGRFHGVALALCGGTPVLAVTSNTSKIEGLIADAGLEPWRVTRPDQIDADLLARAGRWHHNEQSAIRAYLDRADTESNRLFADIRSLVD